MKNKEKSKVFKKGYRDHYFSPIKSFGLVLIGLLFAMNCPAQEFFVSSVGNDSNPGTHELPLRTISYVKEQVRKWNRTNGSENITVWLSGGEYRLSKTIVFGLGDGAKPGQTITYAALLGEKPVISSDVTISGWRILNKKPRGLPGNAKEKIWVVPVPESVTDFQVLYNSQGMLPRVRTKAIARLRKCNDWVGTKEYRTTIPFIKDTTDELFNSVKAEIVVIGAASLYNEYFAGGRMYRYGLS